MSIPTLMNHYAATLPQSQSQAQSSSSDASQSNGGAGAGASSASATSPASPYVSSTHVILSNEAQVIAKFNAAGITVTESSLAGLKLPSFSSGESATDYGQQITQALKGFAPITPPTGANGKADGFISQSALESVVTQFGGSKAEADPLFTALDGGDGSPVSHAELLSAMAGTASTPNCATSQTLMKLADTNGDGTVSGVEFTSLETALIAAEKPGS